MFLFGILWTVLRHTHFDVWRYRTTGPELVGGQSIGEWDVDTHRCYNSWGCGGAVFTEDANAGGWTRASPCGGSVLPLVVEASHTARALLALVFVSAPRILDLEGTWSVWFKGVASIYDPRSVWTVGWKMKRNKDRMCGGWCAHHTHLSRSRERDRLPKKRDGFERR